MTGDKDLGGEETNWDDEAILNESPIVYPQPIVRAESLPPVVPSPDLENWDEALPAATVTNSNTQQTRRSKNPAPIASEDPWINNMTKVTFSLDDGTNFPPQPSAPSQIDRVIGFWAATIQQFRRILPAPARQLSDAILTAIVVLVLTIAIWFVDGFLAPLPNPQVAATPKIAVSTPARIGPEQAFIEAIESQLSDITTKYPDDIIRSLQVDPDADRLIVDLNPVWYLIGEEQQDRVTDRMWLEARANHFTKLELRDDRGQTIARNPVVGKHLVILQRRQS